jgi:hypothetical protein
VSTIGLTSACPQCGAPIKFGGAHSVVCVCEHCQSLIARAESTVEKLGKVPDLVAIDTRLALGDSGRMQELTFRVLGRLQLQQGVASWNEWYVAWSDGTFGWLAEAAGRVIVSRRLERRVSLPAFGQLEVGQRVALQGVGEVVIEELGDARVLSAQGELPFLPQLEHVYRFADGSLSGGLYATFEYGDADEPSDVFVGRELSYEAAGLAHARPERSWQAPQTSGVALRCPSCGGPISLKLSSSLAVVCPHCNKLFSHEHGELALVRELKRRHQPVLPLGARGKLFDQPLEVIGWTRRAVTIDSVDYSWDEYLLHGPNGYSWLSENKGHWTCFTLLPAAAVTRDGGQRFATYNKTRFAHFQRSDNVRYVDVQGEFYWQINPDERAQIDDYVRPPHQLSTEHTAKERIWTYGQHISAEQLWQSFGQAGSPPTSSGIGPCQPNPYAKHKRDLLMGLGFGAALLVLFTVALAITQPKRVRLVHHVPVTAEQPVSLSDPFELRGGMQAVEISAHSDFDVGNGWSALDVSLIEEQTGRSDDLDLEVSLFSGYSDGESWVEDGRHAEQRLGGVTPGRYVLRVEPHFDPAYSRPTSVRMEVAQGAYLWLPLWLCMLALSAPVFIWWVASSRFEASRWSESDHPGSNEL